MKKKLLLTLTILLGCVSFAKAEVEINSKNFPDAGFRTWVQSHFNKPNGVTLTDEELASVKEILSWEDNDFHDVGSLQGIEYFPELETLGIFNCKTAGANYNTVKRVDLTRNKKLKKFIFTANQKFTSWNPERVSGITSLDHSSAQISSKAAPISYLIEANLHDLPELEIVDLDEHGLLNLDLRGCKSLKSVKVTQTSGDNTLRLKMDTCTNLETLCITKIRIVEGFDLGKTPNLKSLKCDYCSLSSLDVSTLRNLEELSCSGNDLAELDLSNCKKLKNLNCCGTSFAWFDFNQLDSLTSIDISNSKSLRTFPALPSGIKTIVCDNVNAFAKVKVNIYPNLTSLSAKNCGLTEFDAVNLPNLTALDLSDNHIAAVNLAPGLTVKKDNFKIDQSLNIIAIPEGSQTNFWRVVLPKSVDLSHIYSYDFNSSEVAQSSRCTLYKECYQDGQGEKFPSFVTNYLPTNSSYVWNFHYQYKTGAFYEDTDGTKKELLSKVTVYTKRGATGVDDVAAAKAVKGVKYFDLQGHESAEPFSGFNIEVTQYTDGTTSSTKVVR